MVRLAASRTTANASRSRSSSSSPRSSRERNSPVFARSASSLSAEISGSSASMSGTSEERALTLRPSPARSTRVKMDMNRVYLGAFDSQDPPAGRSDGIATLTAVGEAVQDVTDEEEPRPPAERLDPSAPIVTSVWARALVAGAALYYILLFAHWTTRNHDGFGTYGFDLGIYDQGLWLMSRFHRPFITIMGRHLFGDHTSFILLPLVPFYWLAPSAKVILWAQSFALGIAAIPVFLIARDKLRNEWLAALLGIAYLAHPAVGWA